ncbi:MFS transporter [Phycicoccus sp. DTK01]|uniref:MFS transporter n=1 Tax=Phycicoccus sp. DTK01 TaxID=2785745 RepID=UPI001A8E1AE9|nr:MFS transporter [Phycicoccus sp. DTK01]GIL37170.1 putative transporter [Phycicoccus sp. DTK01]
MTSSTETATTPEGGPGHRAGTAGHRRVVLALFAAGIATFVLLYAPQAVFPQLSDDFGVSRAASTWSLSATTAALALTLLVVGPLSDRVGRTRIVHLSLASSALVAAACALAPSWPVLVGLRALEGVTLAGLPAVATAYLREELHASTQARAAGLYIAGTAVGGMAGRLLTGPLAEVAGWRWALAGAAAVGAVCAVVVRAVLPPARGFVAVAGGARAVARRARRAVTDPALLALYATGACGVGAFTAVFNTLGFRVEAAPFHLGLGAASLLFLVYPAGSLGSALAGRLADRVGRRAVAPVGVVVALVGLLLTAPDRLPVVVAGVAVLTAGFFVVHGLASGWVPARAHAGGVATGQAAALYLFSYYLGASVSGALAGHLWADHGWAGVLTLAALLLASCGVLSLVLHRTRPLGVVPTLAGGPSLARR